MTTRANLGTRLWPTALVFGALLLHALTKLDRGLLGEMLWACHVASLLVGLGLLARQTWLNATGTLFHVGVGVPAYILDLVVLQSTTPTSVLVHVVPPLLGLRALRREGVWPCWPRWTPLASGALYVCLIPLSRWLTEPALNVNLAFRPWAPLATLSPSPWPSWLGNLLAMAVLLPLADRWVRRWLGPVGSVGAGDAGSTEGRSGRGGRGRRGGAGDAGGAVHG